MGNRRFESNFSPAVYLLLKSQSSLICFLSVVVVVEEMAPLMAMRGAAVLVAMQERGQA